MFGYFGKILRVDLTSHAFETEDLDPETIKQYVGGVGIGAKILYEETSMDADPLGPDNILVAMTGPFTATAVPSSSRHHVMARSPLTGIFGESNVGGSWAVHFKKAGFDGIAVTDYLRKQTEFDTQNFVFTESGFDFVWDRFDLLPDGRICIAPERNAYEIRVLTPAGEVSRRW